eukprot:EG_transcript_8919
MARVGYRVEYRPPPFFFPITHEFEIDEVMEQLKQIQVQKNWGNFEMPLERVCSSNLSSISLSLHRPESCREAVSARTALMNRGSMRNPARAKSYSKAVTSQSTEAARSSPQHEDIADQRVDSFGSSGDEKDSPPSNMAVKGGSGMFSGIPTLEERLDKAPH